MVVVDDAKYQKPGGKKMYCHMVAYSRSELHAFANKIGLGRHFFHASANLQHYDLTEDFRARAVANGAVEVDSRELVNQAKQMVKD